MAQFTVYRNKDSRTKTAFPLLVDVQSNLLEALQTRVVVPLTKVAALTKKPLTQLTPVLSFDGEDYLLMTPQLAESDEPSSVQPLAAWRTSAKHPGSDGLSADGIPSSTRSGLSEQHPADDGARDRHAHAPRQELIEQLAAHLAGGDRCDAQRADRRQR